MLSMVMKSDEVRSVGKTQGIVGGGDDNVNFDVDDGDVRVEDDADGTDEVTCCM